MNVLIFDFETTVSNKGHFADQTNKAVCLGVKWNMSGNSWTPTIYYENMIEAQEAFNRADMLVAFNAKFDLHWLRNIGIDFSDKRIWDCQLAEFILNNQKTPYPSLDKAAVKYGFPLKLDVVKTDYWDKGIDTDEIPREILSDYLTQDLVLTEQVYLKQISQFETNGKLALFKLQCQDLLVLEEMEYNGIVFDTKKARERANEIEQNLAVIYNDISRLVGNIPFNLGSNDHLSARPVFLSFEQWQEYDLQSQPQLP